MAPGLYHEQEPPESACIYSGSGHYLGVIEPNGAGSFEAFSADRVLLGAFAYDDDAINALFDCRDAKLRSNGGDTPAAESPSLAAASPMLAARLAYAERGWDSFPADISLDEETGKFKKKSYKAAKHSNGAKWGKIRDPEQIRKDFQRWPDAGVGIATGPESGIFVVETDTPEGHNVDGDAALAALEQQHGRLPDTLMAISPSGSKHRYYKHPGGGIKVISRSIAPGVDVKGDGGMVIAPPSVRGDGVYRWLNDKPIADAPQWLIDLITAKSNGKGADAKPRIDVAPAFRHLDPNNGLGQGVEYPTANIEEIRAAFAVIPNDNRDWDDWNKCGMALFHATGGSDDGLAVFHAWSSKSEKYDEQVTTDKWALYKTCPPDEIGAGSIFYWADQADPSWRDRIVKEPPLPDSNLFQTSAEFVADFKPPDYLIDGLLQRRYVYSFTAKTGDGKTAIALLLAACVARGTPLAGREVEKGRVLFFAGENPDDVRSRWIMLCEALGEDPDRMDVVFMPFTLNLSQEVVRARIDAEAAKAGPFSLLIVDTSASYYSGDDENDNVALGNHARMLRTFVNLPGGPTILVTCHPIKTPDMANLLPRGGGAFLAEVDGNLVAIKDTTTMLVEVTTHGKFRGPDFAPFAFQLMPSTSLKLVDSKGRLVWSIYAQTASNTEQETLKQTERVERGLVLQAMRDHPDYSLTDIAKHWGWSTGKGEPSKQKVHRLMSKLQKAKLVEQDFGGGYKLTTKGQKVAKELPKLNK